MARQRGSRAHLDAVKMRKPCCRLAPEEDRVAEAAPADL